MSQAPKVDPRELGREDLELFAERVRDARDEAVALLERFESQLAVPSDHLRCIKCRTKFVMITGIETADEMSGTVPSRVLIVRLSCTICFKQFELRFCQHSGGVSLAGPWKEALPAETSPSAETG